MTSFLAKQILKDVQKDQPIFQQEGPNLLSNSKNSAPMVKI